MSKDKLEETETKEKNKVEVGVFENILYAIGVLIYFASLNILYAKIPENITLFVIEICSGILLITSIVLMEIAYNKDSNKFMIRGIEFLFLTFHSLSIKYMIMRYNYQLQLYLLVSSYMFSIYFVLKSIINYTKNRQKDLKNLSDVSELVKDEPQKKEAKKRNVKTKRPRKTKTTNKIEEKDKKVEVKK